MEMKKISLDKGRSKCYYVDPPRHTSPLSITHSPVLHLPVADLEGRPQSIYCFVFIQLSPNNKLAPPSFGVGTPYLWGSDPLPMGLGPPPYGVGLGPPPYGVGTPSYGVGTPCLWSWDPLLMGLVPPSPILQILDPSLATKNTWVNLKHSRF